LNWAIATLFWDTRAVLIGERIRAIREAKNLTQGDVEKQSGLRASYVSRVEHGHAPPSVEIVR
jgi:transcriptional regulator with XRE-family HTH domain